MDGKENAWRLVRRLDPDNTCRRALASFDSHTGEYLLTALGQEFHIHLGKSEIISKSGIGRRLLRGRYLFELCLLWYLIGAQEMPLSGDLIKPEQTKGGQIYRQGAHVLPLDQLALRFDGKREDFFRECSELGGEGIAMGDAACRLLLFPRLPATLVLWDGDEEFSASASLLLDASCELHLPPDAIWASAASLVHYLLSDQ